MAIIRSLAIGKARKSAGNLTFATIQGRTIAREKPAFVRNPNTPKQLAQRSKMSKTVAAYRAFGGMVKKYFTTLPKYTSQYNEFVSRNISVAENYVVDEETGKVSNIVGTTVSRGSVQMDVYSKPKAYGEDTLAGSAIMSPGFTAVEGDQIITVAFDGSSNTLKTVVQVLSQMDLDDINAGNGVDVTADINTANLVCAAYVYYSPSRNISSTAQLEELEA